MEYAVFYVFYLLNVRFNVKKKTRILVYFLPSYLLLSPFLSFFLLERNERDRERESEKRKDEFTSADDVGIILSFLLYCVVRNLSESDDRQFFLLVKLYVKMKRERKGETCS